MGTKTGPESSSELPDDKTSTSSSIQSASGSKVSIFASKSGFVIPKNKLSGSLVPIFRGSKKLASNDQEGSNSDPQRKTKWGPDLTQDASVKKGRVLAYQTRVDQIAEQLRRGILDLGEYEVSDAEPADSKTPKSQIEAKGSLELEKREVIGEILKLNPSYKAPPDYKPLLKEAAVVIPVKDHPAHNFVDLICGSGNQTQKRLEKETGAKLQLYGIESGSTEKVEILTSGANQTNVTYSELTVLVSADTFEKVDAAVSVIELLVSSISGNPVAGDIAADDQTPTPVSSAPDVTNQEAAQQEVGEALQGSEFRHQQESWVSQPTSLTPIYPSQMSSNPQDPNLSPLFNTSPLQSHLVRPPPSFPPSMFSSVSLQSLPTGHHPQSNPYPPRNFPTPAPQQPFPTMVTSQGQMMIPRPGFAPLPSSSISGPNFAFPGNNVQSRQQLPMHQFPGVRMNSHSSATQNSVPVLPPQQPRPNVGLAHFPGPLPTLPRGNAFPGGGHFPGNSPNFYPPMGRHPSVAAAPPPPPQQQQHSVHGDFTFQSHHPLNPRSQVNRPMMQPNSAVHTGAHMFHRPLQMGGQMGLSRPDVLGFAGSSSLQPRLPQMMAMEMGAMRSANQMQHHQQAYPAAQMRTLPREMMGSNHQQLGSSHLTFGPRPVAGQQVYDPFSPSAAPHQPGMGRKPDNNDPEYEDLMASVGVK